jgi:hypothetical protein
LLFAKFCASDVGVRGPKIGSTVAEECTRKAVLRRRQLWVDGSQPRCIADLSDALKLSS